MHIWYSPEYNMLPQQAKYMISICSLSIWAKQDAFTNVTIFYYDGHLNCRSAIAHADDFFVANFFLQLI